MITLKQDRQILNCLLVFLIREALPKISMKHLHAEITTKEVNGKETPLIVLKYSDVYTENFPVLYWIRVTDGKIIIGPRGTIKESDDKIIVGCIMENFRPKQASVTVCFYNDPEAKDL